MNATTITPAPLRAWSYARVSQDKRNGRSTTEQHDVNQSTIDRFGWDNVRRITDDDQSASGNRKRDPEGWNAIRSGIANRELDVLVVWAASRAQRDLEAYTHLRKLLRNSGVLFCYDGNVYDMNKRSDRFRTGIDALVAEDYADQIQEAVERAMSANAAKGKPHGRVPYGYQRVYDTNGVMTQQIDPETAPIIVEAARRFLAGESTRAIAKDFVSRKLPTPSEIQNGKERDRGVTEPKPDKRVSRYGWQAYMIRRILVNPAINGKRKHRGEAVADGQWEPIIDDSTFKRIEARFNDPGRKTIRQRDAVRLLTGVARCGVCDGPMGFAFKRTRGEVERGIYSCRMYNHVARHQIPLEEMVTDCLIEYMSANDLSDDDPAPEYVETQRQIAELEAAKETSKSRAATDPNYSIGDHMDTVAILNGRIGELQRSVKIRNVPTVAVDMASSDNPAQYWQSLVDGDRVDLQREILRAALRVRVHPVKNHGSHRFDRDSIEIVPVY